MKVQTKKNWKQVLFFMAALLFVYCLSHPAAVEAKSLNSQKKAYTKALSKAIRKGKKTTKLGKFKNVSKGKTGKNCFQKAAIANRAAIIAEGIDFLDDNLYGSYYKIVNKGSWTYLKTIKLCSRSAYKKKLKKVNTALKKATAGVDPAMNDAEKAMAVYLYFAKNTIYEDGREAHTGYDILVNHTGVCDGFANAYAAALNKLGIQCAVVSSYTRNHSWNIVKIGKKWYFVDLTVAVGNYKICGQPASFGGFLAGKKTFLETHPGYNKKDLYGEGNSDCLNLKKLKISSSDYIKDGDMKDAIEVNQCLFYRDGYWYSISVDNKIIRSKLNGKSVKTFYIPPEGYCIGCAETYSGGIVLSMNDGFYLLNVKTKSIKLIKKVQEFRTRTKEVNEAMGAIYAAGFRVNGKKLTYNTYDYGSVRKGKETISLP